MMRILFIIQWFQPEPTLKGLPFAKELIKRGHDVQVLTGFPNYPGGKVFEGYRIKPLQKEDMDGVSVVRVPLYPSHDKSSIRRIVNYTSYALSASVIGPWAINRADVAYVYHPPATTFFPASVIKLLRRIPLVYDIQDFWPDSLAASGMFQSKMGLWLVDRYCRLFYRAANKIVVLSPGFKKKLCEKGVPEDKIEVIYNWSDDSKVHSSEQDPVLASELGLDGHFNVMFAGNMGKVQALEAVLDAANILQPKYSHLQFVFIGGGVEVDNLKKKAKDIGLKNVLFLARRPLSEIGGIMSLADVLLVHLKDDPLFAMTIPSKTQTYMSVGKPILMGVRGDAADLVERSGAGLKCEPQNPQSIATMVEKFLSMPKSELTAMGEKGKRFYRQELSLAVGAKHFEKLFLEVAKKST